MDPETEAPSAGPVGEAASVRPRGAGRAGDERAGGGRGGKSIDQAGGPLTFSFAPRPPFDFTLTVRVLRRRPRNAVDRLDDDGTWSRLVEGRHGPFLLRGRQRGARVRFEAAPAAPADLPALRALVTRMFGLDLDVSPFFRRARADPAFAPLLRCCAGLRPQRFPTLFEALANAVCCQQLSLESGLTLLGRLAERFGAGAVVNGMSCRAAPDPARVAAADPAEVRAVGLSARRAASLQALARLDLDRLERDQAALADDEVRRDLLALPGVGPWTADYVMLRGLGRLTVFPRGDVGAARTLGRLLGRDVSPSQAPLVAERLAPLEGMLYFCMLGWSLASRPRP